MRLRTQLTPELADELVRTHEAHRDFRQATAVACSVNPTTLSKWLSRGLQSDEDEPYSSFAVRFLHAETSLRRDVLNVMMTTEDKVQLSSHQWFMERRFKQWSNKPIQTPESEAMDALEGLQQKGGLTNEQKAEVIGKWLRAPTPWLLKALTDAGFERTKR